MDCIISPQNSYVEAQTPNVTIFADRAFRDLVKVKLDHKGKGEIQ